MSAREELAAVLAKQGWCCSPDDHLNSGSDWERNGDCSDCDSLRFATADALLASPALADLIREGGCQHENVRTFRTHPPHAKCVDCGQRVERRWVTAP